MDYNLKNYGLTFQVVSGRLPKIDISGRRLKSLRKLRLYHPLDVQR